MKSKINKIVKVATSALLVGATLLMPIAAVDLGSLPAPFVEDNSWNCVAVIGTGGDSRSGLAEDLVSSAQVVASFAQHTASVSDATPSITTLSGKTKEVPFFNTLASEFGASLDDLDLPALMDETLTTSKNNDVDLKEKLALGTAIKVEQFEGELGIEIPSAALTYSLEFDTAVVDNGDAILSCADWTDGNATFDEMGSLDVNVLGKPIKIKCLTDSKIVIDRAESAIIALSEIVEYDGASIKLIAVADGTDKAYLEVTRDGESESDILAADESTTLMGVKVKVKSTFPTIGDSAAFAEVEYGVELDETLTAGNDWPYDEDYEVAFDTDGDLKPKLKLIYSPEESLEDSHAIKGVWASFNDAFTIENQGVIADSVKFTFERKADSLYDAVADTALNSEEAIHLSIPAGVTLFDGTSSDKLNEDLWLVRSGSDVIVQSRDNDGKKVVLRKSSGTEKIVTGEYGDTALELWWNGTSEELKVVAGTDTLVLKTYNDGSDFIELSGTDGVADAADIMFGAIGLGSKDFDYITNYGMVVESPEANLEGSKGKLVVSVPEKQQKLTVLIGSEVVVEGDSGKIELAPISIDVAKLDTEITDAKAQNMILFGGPAVNKLVAELGYTREDFRGIGLVEIVNNAFDGEKSALVIAGWDAANTRMASYVASNYADFNLSGLKAVVKGTSVADLVVE